MATRAKFARLACYSREFVEESHIFLENGFWRVLASLASPCNTARRMSASLSSPRNTARRMSSSLVSPCNTARQMLAQARMIRYVVLSTNTIFYMHKTVYLHSPNSPDSPNLCNTSQTCLSQVWQVRATRLGECWRVWRVWRVRATLLCECRQVWQVLRISKNGHFGEYSHLPKTASFAWVLEFAKFACE